MIVKECQNCDYGMLNEISDLICVNDASDKCGDFVYSHECCKEWQNHDNEFYGYSK